MEKAFELLNYSSYVTEHTIERILGDNYKSSVKGEISKIIDISKRETLSEV